MAFVSIFVLGLLYFMFFLACFWVIVFLDNFDDLWKDPKTIKNYSISVIIPAFNEEKTIKKTIKSALKQDYPSELFEVIVVNDGSTDNTRTVCEEYSKKKLIKLINKSNGGKASAVNKGIKSAKGELIYVLDADSIADKKSFNCLIGYFNDDKVAAVTSSMKVSCKNKLCQKIQWIEYMYSILMRKVMSLFNGLYVIPGPGSMYRKRVIIEVGGFNEETLTEDMEIGFNIQHHGYSIENSLNSIVYTNTPHRLNDLYKQRRRWYTGFIEDSVSYKHLYFNNKNKFLGYMLPANVLSTFTLLFLTFYSLYLLSDFVFQSFYNYQSIGFDFLTMLKVPNLTLSLYGLNVFSIIGVVFLAFSLIIIYYSLKASDESLDLKNNVLDYVSYLLFYSFLMASFWVDSIFFKMFFRKRKVGWRYGA